MKKNRKLSSNDQQLFNDAMQDVKPLKQNNIAEPFKEAKKAKIHPDVIEENTVTYGLSDAQAHHAIGSDEFISYNTSGIQAKTLKNLRAGKLPIEGRLDLHGFFIEQARQQVSQFLYNSQEMNKKCVIIIHGKGSINAPPIIKSMLNHWLPQIPCVLAFSSAQMRHGGTGAAYILIKAQPKIVPNR